MTPLTAETPIPQLQKAIHEWARGKGWWDGFPRIKSRDPIKLGRNATHYIGTKLALVHTEVSEAVEALRDGDFRLRYNPETKKPEGLESELADAVIRIFDLAEVLGFNLAKTIAIKMAYNKTRTYRHGGRKA